jgi:hypothetical protein
MDLLGRTREQIEADISRYCSEKRVSRVVSLQEKPKPAAPIKKEAATTVVVSTTGNRLLDGILEAIKKTPGIQEEKLPDQVKKLTGLKTITLEDIQGVSDPRILKISGRYYLYSIKETPKVVFICNSLKRPEIESLVQGVVLEEGTNNVYVAPISDSVLEIYRKFKGSDRIIDTDGIIGEILKDLYTPVERRRAELKNKLMNLEL